MSPKAILVWLFELSRHNAAAATIVGIFVLFAVFHIFRRNPDMPPTMPETIPFLSNTLEVSMDPKAFWARAL